MFALWIPLFHAETQMCSFLVVTSMFTYLHLFASITICEWTWQIPLFFMEKIHISSICLAENSGEIQQISAVQQEMLRSKGLGAWQSLGGEASMITWWTLLMLITHWWNLVNNNQLIDYYYPLSLSIHNRLLLPVSHIIDRYIDI